MRNDYISWEKYFMSLAVLTAQRSKDKDHQVGCCIVDSNNKIVSLGYNGMPNNIEDSDYIWDGSRKQLYVVHAEANAIINAKCNLKNCIMYCTLKPCNECAKLIVQSGIKEVVYLEDFKPNKDYMVATDIIFDKTVKLRKYGEKYEN